MYKEVKSSASLFSLFQKMIDSMEIVFFSCVAERKVCWNHFIGYTYKAIIFAKSVMICGRGVTF